MVDLIKLVGAAIGLGIVGGGAYYGYTKYVKTGIIKIPGWTPPGAIPPGTEPPPTTTPPPATQPPPTTTPPACESVPPGEIISIDFVNPVMGGNQNQWVFKNSYRNRSCISKSFIILMYVSRDGVPITTQIRDMTLAKDQAKGFEWNYIFVGTDRLIGKNRIEFFAWDNIDGMNPLSKSKFITI